MKRKDLIVLLTAGCIVLMIYGAFWGYYKTTLSKSYDEWYKKEYVDKEIRGILEYIHEYNGDPLIITLSVKNPTDEFNLTYGTICVNKDFRDFITIGDSVIKKSGEKLVRFSKSKSEFKELKLNFCD